MCEQIDLLLSLVVMDNLIVNGMLGWSTLTLTSVNDPCKKLALLKFCRYFQFCNVNLSLKNKSCTTTSGKSLAGNRFSFFFWKGPKPAEKHFDDSLRFEFQQPTPEM